MTDGLITRARAALDGVTAGPWETVLLDTDGREFDRGKFRVLRGAYFGHSVGPRGKHLFLAPYSQTDDDADARFIAAARDLVPALVDEVERLTKERDSAVRGQDDWRNDCKALSSAIVGDSGLSAMLVATQARLFKPRAEAAEAKVAKLVEALRRIREAWPTVRDAEWSGGTISAAIDEIDAALAETEGDQK